MKAKTIKKTLKKVHEEWCETITDPEIKELALKNTIITGGSIASMLLREPVNDYDIYFRTKEACLKIAQYYVGRFKEIRKAKQQEAEEGSIPVAIEVVEEKERIKVVCKSSGVAAEEGGNNYQYFESQPSGQGGEYLDQLSEHAASLDENHEELEKKALEEDRGEKFRPVFLTTNAITLSHKVQLVIRFYGEPDQIHENYDFVHCTNYWTSWNKGDLVLRQDALEALLARELRYIGSRYPVCSIIRLRKFIKRGWTINAGQMLKMCMQVSELDLMNFETLEDQLTGVDTAYFMEIIEKLKEKDSEKIDQAYLIEIIDRLF